jgi:hypothetical protein
MGWNEIPPVVDVPWASSTARWSDAAAVNPAAKAGAVEVPNPMLPVLAALLRRK